MYVTTVNSDLLLHMIYVSAIASIISSQAIQKVKSMLGGGKRFNAFISIVISLGIGISYAVSFYTTNILYACWIGIFTLIGAEGLYKTFKGFFGLSGSSRDRVIKNKKDD